MSTSSTQVSFAITLVQKYIEQKSLPNLLFYGPPGTGKTSTIVACAKRMYDKSYNMMCLELNASDQRGIDVVRELIKTFAETQVPFGGGEVNTKLVILDEADAMTRDAQAALRRIMEKYSKTTRFCMICNYVSKIIPALQSRTTKFKFRQISSNDAAGRLKQICDTEQIDVTEDAILDVVKISDGDMRKMVNMLQSIHMSLKSRPELENLKVDRNYVFKLTGFPNPADIDRIFAILLESDDILKSYKEINDIRKNKGISLVSLLKDLSEKLMAAKTPGNMKGNIFKRMADIEYRLSVGASEEKQLASPVGGFMEDTGPV